MRESLCYHVSLSSHMEFAREGRSLHFNTDLRTFWVRPCDLLFMQKASPVFCL
ncbi:hypothetical protein N665_0841s0001 [Sinapis alba]|nr:hypothetical protein N665_0841s0001 [Sinapis alba]